MKLVWDLFPYTVVVLMFAAFVIMNGSIVVGRCARVGGEVCMFPWTIYHALGLDYVFTHTIVWYALAKGLNKSRCFGNFAVSFISG